MHVLFQIIYDDKYRLYVDAKVSKMEMHVSRKGGDHRTQPTQERNTNDN